jgi:DNA mismatch repair protein MLH3
MQRYESQRIKSKNICSHHSTYGVRESTSLFSRENLADAVVLGQVDQKFIACLLPSAEGSGTESQSLVLIDQHAAHERIRVEMFLKEMFLGFLNHEIPEGGVKVKTLDPATPILLTRHEARTLKRSSQAREAFLKWGVQFEQLDNVPEIMDEGIESGDYVQVFVKSIPDVVSNKVGPIFRRTTTF